MRKYKMIVSVLTAVCLIGISGCGMNQNAGKKAEGTVEETAEEAEQVRIRAAEYEAMYREQPVNDLMKGSWKQNDFSKESKDSMIYTEYIPNVFSWDGSGDRYQWGYCADPKNIYSMWCVAEYNAETKLYDCTYYMDILDAVTREHTKIEYADAISELYCADGRVFGTLYDFDEDGILTQFSCVEALPDGTTAETGADLITVMKNHDWLPEPSFVPETQIYYEPATELFYMISENKNKLVICDNEGNEVECLTGILKDQEGSFSLFTSTVDGYLLFQCVEKEQNTIFHYEDGKIEKRYEGKGGPEKRGEYGGADAHGDIVFLYQENMILSWNVESGEISKLYQEPELLMGIADIRAVTRNEKGELLILIGSDLKVVTAQGPEKTAVITIQSVTYWMDYYITQIMKEYEKKHPGIKFEIIEGTEGDLDKKMMEMAEAVGGGEGPDLIVANRNQMLSLQNKDCLLELSEVFTKEVTEQLIPGVVENGMVDGKVWMCSYSPNVSTLMINQKYCGKDSITAKDLLDIIEQKEAEGAPFESIGVGSYQTESPLSLFLVCLSESDLINWEQGVCYFDSDFFIRMLKVCKRYSSGVEWQYSDAEAFRLVKEDKALVYGGSDWSINSFSTASSRLGPEYVVVGFPTDLGNGNKISFNSGIAVNHNTENEDAIFDFLRWMYSDNLISGELQLTTPLRLDAFDGVILDQSDADWLDSPAIRLDDRSYMPIAGKPDGTSYLKEYVALLRNCVPIDIYGNRDIVNNIICEEVNVFLSGDMTAEAAAANVQSRLSLYLMEQQ